MLVAHFRPDIVSGAELAIADFVEAASVDFHCVMLTPGEGPLARHYRQRGFEVWAKRVETKRRRYPGLHTMQSLLFSRKLRRAGVDVALGNTFPAASRIGTACRMAGVPYGVYVREYVRKTALHRTVLRRADAVLAVSQDVARHLEELVSPEKLFVARDFVDASQIRERVERHGARGAPALPFPAGTPAVGIVGRLTRYKRQDLFLRAIPDVLARVPEARFVLVGSATAEEKDYEESLRVLATSLGVADRVAFLGQREDAVEILSELTVCCLISDREPFPRVLLEAQLAGCPVVASDSGGCPEIVEDGVTGFLFPSETAVAVRGLAERVIRILENRALADTLRKNARERVLKESGSSQPVRLLEERLRALTRSPSS